MAEDLLTVLFTDVEGSTDLRTRQGDESAHSVLRTHEGLVREVVATHGGREVKALGDGFMIAFGSVRRAIACAVEIQDAQRRRNLSRPSDAVLVRVGLNAGEVNEEDGDLYGESVNAAARIAAIAGGGEILCSDVVRLLSGTVPKVSFADRGHINLKGFPEPWHLWQVTWEESLAAPKGGPTPFVARENERADLVRLLEAARQGHGAVVLVGGEPGVGKTRLAQELALDAERREMGVRVGRCYEMDVAPPYNPFIEMLEAIIGDIPADRLRQLMGDDASEIARAMLKLRRMFPDLPAPLEVPPEHERKLLLDALRSFIARGAFVRPQLLVLEDLHWADEGTLLLLRHIAEEIRAMSVVVVGTYRDVELDSSRPFARTLENLLRERLAQRMALRRLSEEAVVALLASLGGQQPPAALVRVIYAETEGNPFFIEEVFKHLLEEGRLMDESGRFRSDLGIRDIDVPEGVRLVIGRRVERLGDRALQVLTAAAVIGRGFTFELLDAITEIDTDSVLDAVDEAERAAIVRSERVGGAARIVFSHELIRQTLLGRLSLPHRQRLHARVGESIETLSGSSLDDHLADLAYHFDQAGPIVDQQKSLYYTIQAGERALDAAAFEDALAHFERALALQDVADDAALAKLFKDLGLARRSVGEIDEAVLTWGRALDIYERLGDTERLGRLVVAATNQLSWLGRFDESVVLARRGMAMLANTDSPNQSRLLAQAGMAMSIAGNHGAAVDMLHEALQIADQHDDDRLRAEAIYASGIHHYAWARPEDAVEALSRSMDLFKETNMTWELTNAAAFMSLMLMSLGRFDDSLAVVEDYASLAGRLGNRIPQSMLEQARGNINFMRSADLEAWVQSANKVLDLAVGPVRDALVVDLVLADFWRGDWERALERIDEQSDFPGAVGGAPVYYRALIHAYLNDRAAAANVLEANRSQLPRLSEPISMRQWAYTCVAVESFYLCQLYEKAAALRPLMEEALRRGTVVNVFGPRLMRTLAGMAAAAASDWDAAHRHFEAAIQLGEQLPNLIEQADTRLFYAQMLLDRAYAGDQNLARSFLRQAFEIYDRIGMPRHAALVMTIFERA
jgi:class 3 adenylate cyclase/tetratricopeptide (TPR) repeat protein